MYSARLCTTDNREIRALDLGIDSAWERLTQLLRREISPECAALLAEPVQDTVRGQMHWLAISELDPRPYLDLGSLERNQLDAKLDARRREILALAARLAASDRELDRRLSGALRTAIQTPDDKLHVWDLGGKPVLSAWGHVPSMIDSQDAIVVGRGLSPERPSADAVPTSSRIETPAIKTPSIKIPLSFPASIATAGATISAGEAPRPVLRSPFAGFMLAAAWALFAAIVFAIYYTLLPACAFGVPLFGQRDRCFAPSDPELIALRERNTGLREALRSAENRTAEKAGNCKPPQKAGNGPTPVGKTPPARPALRQ